MNTLQTTILAHIAGILSDPLAPSDLAGVPFDLDSFSTIQLLLDLEQTFGMEFADEYLAPEAFATMGDVARYVEAQLQAAG